MGNSVTYLSSLHFQVLPHDTDGCKSKMKTGLCWNHDNCDRSKCIKQHMDDPHEVDILYKSNDCVIFSPSTSTGQGKSAMRRSMRDLSNHRTEKKIVNDIAKETKKHKHKSIHKNKHNNVDITAETFCCTSCESFFNSLINLELHQLECTEHTSNVFPLTVAAPLSEASKQVTTHIVNNLGDASIEVTTADKTDNEDTQSIIVLKENKVDNADGEVLVEGNKPNIVIEEGVNANIAIRADGMGDEVHTSSCNDPACVTNTIDVLDDNCPAEEATSANVISFTDIIKPGLMNTSIVDEVVPSPVKVLPLMDDIFVPSLNSLTSTHTDDVVSEKVSTSHEQLELNADVNTPHIAIASDSEQEK